MQKFKITFLIIFLTLNLFSQDTIGIPDNTIKSLIQFQVELNEPVKQFPLVKSDSLKILNFEDIKLLTLEIEKELELVYIKYYSETKAGWSKKDFTNHFNVKSKIKNNSGLDYYHINFEIDTTKNQSILNNEPILESGISLLGSESHTEIVQNIIPEKNDSVNHFGNLPVKIKYLTAYDTIKLSKNDIGNKFKIGVEEYKLQSIRNGNIYIRSLDSSNDLENLENSRYISYKNQKIVHLPEQNNFPIRFQKQLKMLSIILNDSLIQLPRKEYENYLKNLKLEKNKLFVDLLILDTKVDFDKIYILIPKYDFLSKELKGRIVEKNVDNIEIVRHSFPVQKDEIKGQTINN